ncbi:MAG: Asp-tRNA(Asn)/Glu-tRNA(Gln) amidotransferase subunit GatB [Candidatus Wildermuthbacteria bacterium]|nr:Asp-tRNA(Asn)/Glu-tRNA(Gln) amidotransferase subunit GatB [Candidatus Wildermuthbacteria bacterium]
MNYTPTIGLEIHAELKTKSKMFCASPNDPLETRPNVNVCPVCMGHPGTLPVANQEAVHKVIKVGLALHCKIPEFSKFDRKNYFYPDLPKGYQISQYDMPFCKEGHLEIAGKKIRITRVHLEEDTARLVHPEKMNHSLVDFNRAGVPLMELVTEPDIVSAKEAKAFAEALQTILRYLNVSDADMEKGQMRVEANISVRSEKQKELGTKVEVKNLNSFQSVEKAIEFEIERQTSVLESGQKVSQVTMGWDPARGTTFVQREKEEAHDYRYFPEPDLPPLRFTKKEIEELKRELPELPEARRKRFQDEYKISEKETDIFVRFKDLGEYFEKVASELGDKKQAKLAANYILSDLLGLLEGASVIGKDFRITPEDFAELVILIHQGTISSNIAKQVLKEMFATGGDPHHIIDEKGLKSLTNTKEIEEIAKEVIVKNPKAVEDYKKGKETALQFFIGQMMAKTRGTVSPDLASKTLKQLLK